MFLLYFKQICSSSTFCQKLSQDTSWNNVKTKKWRSKIFTILSQLAAFSRNGPNGLMLSINLMRIWQIWVNKLNRFTSLIRFWSNTCINQYRFLYSNFGLQLHLILQRWFKFLKPLIFHRALAKGSRILSESVIAMDPVLVERSTLVGSSKTSSNELLNHFDCKAHIKY